MILTTPKTVVFSVLIALVGSLGASLLVVSQDSVAEDIASDGSVSPATDDRAAPSFAARDTNSEGSAAGEDADGATGPRSTEILADDFSLKEQAIADRAEARWHALANLDFDAAYGFTLPSYRQTHTAEQYRRNFGVAVKWHMAKVLGIRYDSPSTAQVRLALDAEFVPTSGGPAERLVTRLDETWLERDGSWYISVTR